MAPPRVSDREKKRKISLFEREEEKGREGEKGDHNWEGGKKWESGGERGREGVSFLSWGCGKRIGYFTLEHRIFLAVLHGVRRGAGLVGAY